jgi:ubiquinone/menaquinone biosynthesis C-methylase UbiE
MILLILSEVFMPYILIVALLFLQTVSPQIKRKPAPIVGIDAAGWMTRPEREEEEHPEELLDALKIKEGDVVADIGAGVGYLTFRLSKRVGSSGKVYAEEIQEEMIDRITFERDQQKIKNVVPVLGTPRDPKLPPVSMDLVLIVDVYHEFAQPAVMMEKIRASLTPAGRCVLVEYRAEDPKLEIASPHKMTAQQVLEEIVPMGFRHLETLEVLPRQHIIIFSKQNN